MSRRGALLLALAGAVAAPLAAMASAGVPGPPATFVSYAVTDGHRAVHGGEPSIGYDGVRHVVLYGAAGHETRLRFLDAHGRTTVVQQDASAPTAVTTLDAITYVDSRTGRAVDSQLLTACSAMSTSGDAGATWTPSSGCGQGTLLDHQTVGGGPFHAPLAGNPAGSYPDAVYYCAQNSFNATCAISLDGGRTFGPGTPISNTPANRVGDGFGGACSGLHGHLRVGPDGTAYVPIKGCGGTPTAGDLTNTEFAGGAPAVSVSEDNGLTWTVHTVPDAHNADESDPSVAADRAGTVWLGWQDTANPTATVYGTTSAAKIAYSRDHGHTWSAPFDVGRAVGVRNIQFPEVIAGDAGRIAYAFLGTKAVGDDQHNGFRGADGKPAVWHLYVALTYDGGRHWATIDTTPTKPVQRGCVDLQGTSNRTVTDSNICKQRNLLDFNDITVDDHGRVLVAYADGCTGSCATDAEHVSTGDADMLMRLARGKGLYAAFDGRLG